MDSPKVSSATIRKSTSFTPRPSSSGVFKYGYKTQKQSSQRASLAHIASNNSPAGLSPSRTNTQSRDSRLSPSFARKSNNSPDGSESNIHVYVRCRARNQREVKENSGVILSTTGGIDSKQVTLHGANSYNDKTYTYDHVFGPESDQEMVFNTMAVNTMDEMLAGYNCTIFAYGQTGTGKTYTMTGDLDSNPQDESRPPKNAGIIPRILFALFKRLKENEDSQDESSVKLSYIELYNEELKDLLAVDSDKKVRIFDDKKSVSIHGMEEVFVRNPQQAMNILRQGSERRQEATTKCNDHSSRSHAVFTITVNIKHITAEDNEWVRTGKLNLVDLAGSENINRSGAENKRAREAGMINQSLLTLGRVINALVERSQHIPYRESKLTRILQDSLGGGTKTCVIATCSPAKVSLDETTSTLEYANRAKNIKNKPQMNQKVSKQAHIEEYIAEIDRLRADLAASRQKNGGVYLSGESYEALTAENESRRILVDEQKMRLDILESQIHDYREESENYNKNLDSLKNALEEKETKITEYSQSLENVNSKLETTKGDLECVEKKLEEEREVNEAHKTTEGKLANVGKQLAAKLDYAIEDIYSLNDKVERQKAAHSSNASAIHLLANKVSDFSSDSLDRQQNFLSLYQKFSKDISHRLTSFVDTHMEGLDDILKTLDFEVMYQFNNTKDSLSARLTESNDNTDEFLRTIESVRHEVTTSIGESLKKVKDAAASVSENLSQKLTDFSDDIESSYADLGKQNEAIIACIQTHIAEERKQVFEIETLLKEKSQQSIDERDEHRESLLKFMEEERVAVEKEKSHMLEKMTEMINRISARRIGAITENLSATAFKMNSLKEKDIQYFTQELPKSLDEAIMNRVPSTVAGKSAELERALSTSKAKEFDYLSKFHQQCESLNTNVDSELYTQVETLEEKMKNLDLIINYAKQNNDNNRSVQTRVLEDITSTFNNSHKSLKTKLDSAKDSTIHNHEFVGDELIGISSTVDDWFSDSKGQVETLDNEISETHVTEPELTGSTPQLNRIGSTAAVGLSKYQNESDILKTKLDNIILPINK